MDTTIDQLESQVAILQRRLDESEATVKRLTIQLDKAVAGQHLATAAAAAGVAPKAIPDAVDRALRHGRWKVDAKGRMLRHREDDYPDLDGQGNPITPQSVIESFFFEAPYYWPTGAQAPAGPSAHSAAPAGKAPTDLNDIVENPWKIYNLTRQGEIYARDPDLAQQLADAAGVPLLSGWRATARPGGSR